MPASECDEFCRSAFAFLERHGTRSLVIGGLAVVAVGEPRTTASPEDLILLKVLAGRDKDMLDATGVARRHAERLDIPYLEQTLRPICDLAEDMTPWNRLKRVLVAIRPPDRES